MIVLVTTINLIQVDDHGSFLKRQALIGRIGVFSHLFARSNDMFLKKLVRYFSVCINKLTSQFAIENLPKNFPWSTIFGNDDVF